MTEPQPVILDPKVAFDLTADAINNLLNDSDEGCCPECCGPCSALKKMLDSGQLDEVLRPYAEGWDWWDSEKGTVKADEIQEAWAMMTNCICTDDMMRSVPEQP